MQDVQAIDLSAYLTAGSVAAVPSVAPSPAPQPKKQTQAKPKAEPLIDLRQAILIGAVIVIAFAMFFFVISQRINVMQLEKKISSLQTEIAYAQSENIRLNRALDTTISREKIDEYAVSVLGLRPIERYQVHYFSSETGDQVVLAGGKTVERSAPEAQLATD